MRCKSCGKLFLDRFTYMFFFLKLVFHVSFQGVRFVLVLKNNLPSESPLDGNWPKCSVLFTKASEELKVIHHTWRVCGSYVCSI